MPAAELQKIYSDCYGIVKYHNGKIVAVYYDTISRNEDEAWAEHKKTEPKWTEPHYKAVKMRLLINIE